METGDKAGQRAARGLTAARRLQFVVVALGGACVVSAVFMEVAIRLIAPQSPSWLAIYAESPQFPFFVNQSNLDRTIDIGESRFRILTDARGHRIRARTAENDAEPLENVVEVLALGDSFTFGNGVSYEDSFVGLLDAEPTLHVTNAAVGGHGPEQYLSLLQHELDHGQQPDVVLVSIFAGNDVHDCIWNKDLPVIDGVAGGIRTSLKDRVKRNSHLYRLLSNIYHRYLSPLPAEDARKSLFEANAWREPPLSKAEQEFREAMAEISLMAAQADIPLVVGLIPLRETVDALWDDATERSAVKPDYLLPNRRVLAALKQVGLDPIDSSEALSQSDTSETYFQFDGHLAPKGHRIYFEQIRDPVLTASATSLSKEAQ